MELCFVSRYIRGLNFKALGGLNTKARRWTVRRSLWMEKAQLFDKSWAFPIQRLPSWLALFVGGLCAMDFSSRWRTGSRHPAIWHTHCHQFAHLLIPNWTARTKDGSNLLSKHETNCASVQDSSQKRTLVRQLLAGDTIYAHSATSSIVYW